VKQHFDVAVIGEQISGLIAGALLAKRGRRVLLLDHGENASHYRRKGLRLPLVPTLVPTLDSAPAVQKVHDELGLGPDLRMSSEPLDPVFQAIMPRNRIDVRAEREALLDELRLEFPDLVEPVRRFFERLFALDAEITALIRETPPLPPSGLAGRLRARGALARVAHLGAPFESHDLMAGIPKDHPLRDMLLGPMAFFGYLAPEAPSTLHAVRLIARYYRGVVDLSDSVGGLNATLARAAEQAGVVIRRGAVVRDIGQNGKRLVDIGILDEKDRVTADYFIANTLAPFQELLPASKAKVRYTGDSQAIRPTGSLLVVNLVVDRDVIPRGMGRALFLLNGRRTPRGDENVDPPLLVRRYPAQRGEPGPVRGAESIDDSEHEILSVACPVRTADVARSPEGLAGIKTQMLQRLGRVVPFLRSFLVDTSLPIETTTWDVEGKDVVRRLDPWTLHPIFEPAERPLLGVAARGLRTPFANLVHCGRDVVPGLGLEGEYVTGLGAAEAVQKIAGRDWKQTRG
jgi:phytoene dehydrogenase-like protein